MEDYASFVSEERSISMCEAFKMQRNSREKEDLHRYWTSARQPIGILQSENVISESDSIWESDSISPERSCIPGKIA
jgi:hypothetical protein